MIEASVIAAALTPTMDRVDTPQQAQLRQCLLTILQGHEDPDMVRICYDLITWMRDQGMTQVAQVRRHAALAAREYMSPRELAIAANQSQQTIARLLDEARRMDS
jgi:hypothetical protein